MNSYANYLLSDAALSTFFGYAQERYRILLARRAGDPKPWTCDEVLQTYRFCNVFREDDAVTRWYARHLREPYKAHPNLVFGTIAFRYFNSIPTGRILVGDENCPRGLESGLSNLFIDWDTKELRRRMKGVKPIVGAAYMCTTPAGFSKLEGLINILDRVWAIRSELASMVRETTTMEALVEELSKLYYVGRFRAYEVACDLQYSDLFHPTDTLTWANPGPGAKRGICRLLFGTATRPREVRLNLNDQVVVMRALLCASKDPPNWPMTWPGWDMRTVEHTLCEVDKFQRVLLGEGRPKQKYKGTV